MANPVPKTIPVLLECKVLPGESLILGRVYGFEWQHWIASPKEGHLAMVIGDILGDWFQNLRSGTVKEKVATLDDIFQNSIAMNLREVSSDDCKGKPSYFIELSLFSMDEFRSGFSVAVHGHRLK